jgi:outer membrane phospholipase A
MTKILNGMVETTPKEKAIKQDLQEESVDNCRNESANSFNLLLKELTENNIVIKKIELSETITNEPMFEVTNLKASEIKFEVSFKKTIYEINVDVFISESNLYIYDFLFAKNPVENN